MSVAFSRTLGSPQVGIVSCSEYQRILQTGWCPADHAKCTATHVVCGEYIGPIVGLECTGDCYIHQGLGDHSFVRAIRLYRCHIVGIIYCDGVVVPIASTVSGVVCSVPEVRGVKLITEVDLPDKFDFGTALDWERREWKTGRGENLWPVRSLVAFWIKENPDAGMFILSRTAKRYGENPDKETDRRMFTAAVEGGVHSQLFVPHRGAWPEVRLFDNPLRDEYPRNLSECVPDAESVTVRVFGLYTSAFREAVPVSAVADLIRSYLTGTFSL